MIGRLLNAGWNLADALIQHPRSPLSGELMPPMHSPLIIPCQHTDTRVDSELSIPDTASTPT